MSQFESSAADQASYVEEKIVSLRNELSLEVNSEFTDKDVRRFLVARSYDIAKAKELLLQRYDWYNGPIQAMKGDPAFENLRYKDIYDMSEENKLKLMAPDLPFSLQGESLEGYPIYWEKSGYIALNWSTIRKTMTEDDVFLAHVLTCESLVRRRQKSSEKHGRYIEKHVIVMDLSNIPMFLDWGCLRVLKRMLETDQTKYPETLSTIFVINAPIYFTAIWAIVKPWIDPITLKKIEILGADYLPTLLTRISEDEIPEEYGGRRKEFSWTWPSNYTDR